MQIDLKRQEAANRLEELAIIAKQMVDDIRTGVSSASRSNRKTPSPEGVFSLLRQSILGSQDCQLADTC